MPCVKENVIEKFRNTIQIMEYELSIAGEKSELELIALFKTLSRGFQILAESIDPAMARKPLLEVVVAAINASNEDSLSITH